VIPPERVRYLAEIVENSRAEDRRIAGQCALASRLYRLHGAVAELPRYRDWGDQLRWLSQENVPGRVPVHRRRLSRSSARAEDPTRMFAGEGGPSARTALPSALAGSRRCGCRRPSTA
jgi:hypothetical protein